ncbi:hypothetical protein Q4R69_17100 [Morganella morganii subsp. sibonii]
MKTILLLIIIMVGVFYIIDEQSNKNNEVFENYTIEQLKKCDAISKQADRNSLGDINSYRLNCKNNESIVISKKIYDLQSVKDVTPDESKEQKIFNGVFAFLIISIVIFGVFFVYRAIRE